MLRLLFSSLPVSFAADGFFSSSLIFMPLTSFSFAAPDAAAFLIFFILYAYAYFAAYR